MCYLPELRAVKRVSKHVATWDYKKEIAAMAKCRQFPHQFAYMHGWYEDDSCIYLAIDWFEFGDLSHCVKAQIPEDQAKDIARQLCAGLSAMHQMGFTHRDLKPQNVFVVSRWPPSWNVRIGDFGISKRVQKDETALRTMTGTQAYMAPEMFPWLIDDEESGAYTMAVDMWALGIVIYQLLTSQLPFGDLSPLHRYCKGSDSFPEAPLVGARVTAECIDIVKLLLHCDPEERLTSYDSLAHPWLCKAVAEPPPTQGIIHDVQPHGPKALELSEKTANSRPTASLIDAAQPRTLDPHVRGNGNDHIRSRMSARETGEATSQVMTSEMVNTLTRASDHLLHDTASSDEEASQSIANGIAVEHKSADAVKLAPHRLGTPERPPKAVRNNHGSTAKRNYRVRGTLKSHCN